MTRHLEDLLAGAGRGDGPLDWRQGSVPAGGGSWMLGEAAGRVYAVVPPGAPGSFGETAEQRLAWRLITWCASSDGNAPAGPAGPRGAATQLSVAEVLTLLGAGHTAWVRDVCIAQLRHLESFARSVDGQPHEDRSRMASPAIEHARTEARQAFPDESWHSPAAAEVPDVPDTADALLAQVDGDVPALADVVFERVGYHYYRAVGFYRRALARRRRLLGLLNRSLRRHHVAAATRAKSAAAADRDVVLPQ